MSITIRIRGDRATERYLARVARLAPEAAGKLIHTVAYVVEREAKRRCPVDTGRLRASIGVVYEPRDLAAYVGTNVEYAPYVEFGTRRQRAQPYLQPAAEVGKRDLKRRVRDLVEELGIA